MRHMRALLFATSLLGALTVGFLLGYASYDFSRRPWGLVAIEMDDGFNRFNEFSNKVAAFVVANDGRIPVDPYRGLLDAQIVESFYEFLSSGQLVQFGFEDLPCRANPDLTQNAKAPFFWVIQPVGAEVWVCYLDGSCERQVRRHVMATGALGDLGRAQRSWNQVFHGAGYPYWESVEDKAKWCQLYYDKLIWDPARQIFVPPTEAAQ